MSSMLAAMFLVTGCGKDSGGGGVNTGDDLFGGDSGQSVPDPPGTITANISASTSINTSYGRIYWTSPDNFVLDSRYYNLASICDLGAIQGLGNITI